MSPRYELQRTALVHEMVECSKMALQMASRVQSQQTVHQPVIFEILKRVSVTLAFLMLMYNILLNKNQHDTII